MTDLSLASYIGLKQVVENILSEEDIGVNIEDETSGSALSAGCFPCHPNVVALLLNEGANCNTNHIHGTALDAAIELGHTEIMEMLAKKGAQA
ncbi:hypothetical protein N7471_008526 [Penicillium samsonianum]|uniref:uncharacterized protein n=1 Tax=Penicillium samsonianum TaxID=1882272 RepID=UPI0025489EBC|nr:uncharacterized protein N7471_008526 [Penicillium samsonianum]KAJ6133311.1 hypothetical protein N7471_008526 [Penicillium samsonianum]